MENAAALLPHLAQLRIDRISLKAGRIRIEASTTGGRANCPGCGVASARVHSRYARRLVDSAIGGREVLVTLWAGRLFCDHPGCQKRTFAEQVDGLTVRHGRRTAPAQQTVQAVAMALGGRAGARLVEQVAAPVSRSTLFLAGCGIYAIAEGLTRDGIPSPSAADPQRNPHRCGTAWAKSAVRVILSNPRYTGRQVWNKQRKAEILIDVDDVALGHETKDALEPGGGVDLLHRAGARATCG